MENLVVYTNVDSKIASAKALASLLNVPFSEVIDENKTILNLKEDGLYLESNNNSIKGDFSKLYRRIKQDNLSKELVVKAAKIKGQKDVVVLDATAGLGEDSFLLAAYGFKVKLYERDKVIAALLKDSLDRASVEFPEIISRMEVFEEDSISAMKNLSFRPDVVFLDPMFPQRSKDAAVKKKFQLIHLLEKPCEDEVDLIEAAKNTGAKKIIIKRPLKSEYLGGVKPSYSYEGKAIRYDCIVL